MNILLWISISTIVLFFILHFILKSIKRAIFIIFALFFVLSLVLVTTIISDSKNLENLQTSNSLFVYENEDLYYSAISINFMNSQPNPFTKEELNQLNDDYSNTLADKDYFKIFTFSDQSIDNLLSDPIQITEEVNFTKEEILDTLHSSNQDEIDSSFTIVVLDILNNLQDKEKLSIFLDEHREKRVNIEPPIKAISLISLLPKSFVESILSRL